MAQRRMTSLDVIDTDAFLDMPATTQLLYFQLNARADDDGFVANPKKIMRSIGVNDDDLKLLAAKKFIIIFNDGVCVIKHWRINNYVRKDIYKETRYLDLKRSLFVRQNGTYTTTDDGRAVPLPDGHFQLENIEFPNVDVTSTERALRLGKVSIDKDRIDKIREDKIAAQSTAKNETNEIIDLFKEVNPSYQKLFKNKTQREAADRLIKKYGFEKTKRTIQALPGIINQKYAPRITTPLQLEDRLGDLIAFVKQGETKKFSVGIINLK